MIDGGQVAMWLRGSAIEMSLGSAIDPARSIAYIKDLNNRKGEKMAIGLVAGAAGSAGLGAITVAIQGLYGVTKGINEFLDDHIGEMKSSENQTVSSTGRVLEGAKSGFGIGYISSVAVIAAGQMLLGNTLAAVATIGSAAILTNPIAMTCAAVGAIYYGWSALSDKEREEILEKLTKGLEIGVELIKSVINFVIAKTKEIFSSKNIAEFKGYIKEYSAKFGKSLYDITGAMGDLVKGAVEKASEMTNSAVDATTTTFKSMMETTSDVASRAVDSTSEAWIEAVEKSSDMASNVSKTAKQTFTRQKEDATPQFERFEAGESRKI